MQGQLWAKGRLLGIAHFLRKLSWRSIKQSVVVHSSAKAEFRAMVLGVCELLQLKTNLEELQIKWEEPIRLYRDNKSISIVDHPVQYDMTKHIEVDRRFKLDSGLICTSDMSSQGLLADILTKGLSSHFFEKIVSRLGMDNTYSPA